MDPSKLTKEDKKSALLYLMYLKQKHYRKIKGCGCADYCKQQDYVMKEDSSSLTVSLKALMLSCAINAREGCVMATADIPGVLMQTNMDQTVLAE
jgi:hypothetical protein